MLVKDCNPQPTYKNRWGLRPTLRTAIYLLLILVLCLPIGPIVVQSWASYLELYKVIPKRNDYGAYG